MRTEKTIPKRASSKESRTLALALSDLMVAHRLISSGQLDEHEGKHVAIVDGKVVGVGTDHVELRQRVSKVLGIPYERPAITVVESEPARW